jgi:Tfp pilus assembly protein PilF
MRSCGLWAIIFGWFLLALFCCPGVCQAAAEVTSVRDADAACAECHQKIYTTYLGTRMANASGLAVNGIEPGVFTHAPSGVQYRISLEDGQAWLTYSRSGDPAFHGKQRLSYFLGSGNHGRTYLYSVEGYWFETPIAYYARKRGYDMRPAYLNDKEMPFNLPVSASCLRCHMSGTQMQDAGTRNHYTGLPFTQGGITCEACHGDTAQHVETRGKVAAVNPAKLDPERRDSVCISCHLEGDSNVQHLGRSVVMYKPGDKLSDLISYYVRAGAGTTNRAVSQVEALSLSKCKRVSGDRMSCISCHSPHASIPTAGRAAYYRAKCLACHTQPKYAAAHYSGNQDCTSCHMPKSSPVDIPHEQWTDHRILRQANIAALEDPSHSEPPLTPVGTVNADMSDRDLGLAYYNLAVDGDVTAAARARTLLETAARSNPSDSAVFSALGVLSEIRNDRKSALEFYRLALRDPDCYTAAINLGVLLARSGQVKQAVDLWQTTFSRNQDITELGMNLAAARCMLGDKPAAEDVLRRVLYFNPDHQRARQELSAIESGRQACVAQ